MQGAEILKEQDRQVDASLLLPNHDNRGIVTFYTAREKQLSYEMDQIQNFIDAQESVYLQ